MTPLILQSPSRPTAMLRALESLALPNTEELRFAVAYATLEGCKNLVPRLESRIGARRWQSIPKTVIVTTDFHLTEPAALEYLRSAGFQVRLSEVSTVNYHPKLYAFLSGARAQALVGSANLTLAAMTDNVEAASVSAPTRADLTAAWDELLEMSVELTRALLDRYAKARQNKPPVVPPDRRQSKPPPIRPTALPSFLEMVAAGTLEPANFTAFWTEVGTPSGGSANQVELPRGAHLFFGFGGALTAKHLIGLPALFSGGHDWTDRKLTWHGQGAMNEMERLNMPTLKQGGFSYSDSAVLFTRHGARYQVTVARSRSAIATTWRRASGEIGRQYRVGKTSPRRCGLF